MKYKLFPPLCIKSKLDTCQNVFLSFKECMSDSVTNYNYVGDTKISVSIKKTNADKCTLSEIFLTEILKSISAF